MQFEIWQTHFVLRCSLDQDLLFLKIPCRGANLHTSLGLKVASKFSPPTNRPIQGRCVYGITHFMKMNCMGIPHMWHSSLRVQFD